MSSKAWERAMGALDQPVPAEAGARLKPLPRPGNGRCWRCQVNPSRDPDEDFTCGGCWAFITGASGHDPRTQTTVHRGTIWNTP